MMAGHSLVKISSGFAPLSRKSLYYLYDFYSRIQENPNARTILIEGKRTLASSLQHLLTRTCSGIQVMPLDFTKDDENVNSQPFMQWKDRFLLVAEAIFYFRFFCLEKIDLTKFEFHKEKYKSLCEDFASFHRRKGEVIKILVEDYRKFSLKNGSNLKDKDVLRGLKMIENIENFKQIVYNRELLEKSLTRISKECVKRKAEENQLFSDSHNLSDLGLPPAPEEKSSIPSNPAVSLSLPESNLSDPASLVKSAEGKEKPSAPSQSHNAESAKSKERNTDSKERNTDSKERNTDSMDKVRPSTQSNNPASSLQHHLTPQDSTTKKEGSPFLSFFIPQHNPIKQLFGDKRSSFLALLQQTKKNLGNTILPIVTISFFLWKYLSKGLNPLSLERLPHLDSLMIVNPIVFISIGLSLTIMYLFYRKDVHFNKMIKLLTQVFFLYLVIYTLFEYTNLFQAIINAIYSPETETSVTQPSTSIGTTSPTEGLNNLPNEKIKQPDEKNEIKQPDEKDEKKEIKQPEEKKEIDLPEEKKEIDPPEEKKKPWYKKKKVWAFICGAIFLGFSYWYASNCSSPSSTETNSSVDYSDLINRSVVNTYAENRDLERQVYAAATVFDSMRSEVTTLQTMLRDIVRAGEAARHHLSLMDDFRQDLLNRHPDSQERSILRGIISLIGLRWALSNNSSDIHAVGSDIVNSVLSQDRPFTMVPPLIDPSIAGPRGSGTQPDEEIVPIETLTRNESIATVVVQTANEPVSEVVEPNRTSISTQTSPTFRESTRSPESTGYPDSLSPLTLEARSFNSVLQLEDCSSCSLPPLEGCSFDSATPHNQRLESTDNQRFRVIDNPIFRSTDSPTSLPSDPTASFNPVPSDPPASFASKNP